jgi:hypothetical protein
MTNTDTDGTTNGKTKTEKLGIVPMDIDSVY